MNGGTAAIVDDRPPSMVHVQLLDHESPARAWRGHHRRRDGAKTSVKVDFGVDAPLP
jgi:hypothetical protein